MRKEYDFSKSKPAKAISALAKAQAENAGKERITIRIDASVLQWFRKQVKGGGNYQSLINQALREFIQQQEGTLEQTLRKVIREELNKAA
jgi:uncharacterized protein (DUF4415 family)